MSGERIDLSGEAVRLEAFDEGALWKLSLATPKANILDAEKIRLLAEVWRKASEAKTLRAIVLCADGPNFSFGASVEEHLPAEFEGMLAALHGFCRQILDCGVILLAAVRGHCLGGALEVVGFANRIFAAPDVRLGQPEIKLGVIAPVASLIFHSRIGRAHAEELCLSGRNFKAEEALSIGLVDEIVEDPEESALRYARKHFLPISAAALRLGNRAVRHDFARSFKAGIAEVERLYIDEVMKTKDALEGLEAFLQKRPAKWSHS